MQTFKINNTTLQTTTEFTPVFQIKSHPENYLVKFDTLPDLFLESEIVLVDDNVKQLYNINHSKLITITAIEENKSVLEGKPLLIIRITKIN